jgi:hypothetical protein
MQTHCGRNVYKLWLPEGFRSYAGEASMNERLIIPNLLQNLRMIMKLCEIEHSPSKDIPAGSKRCSYCHRKNNKK